jgi:hypothetical protein
MTMATRVFRRHTQASLTITDAELTEPSRFWIISDHSETTSRETSLRTMINRERLVVGVKNRGSTL